ncbi:MAG: type II toxin-antitoxin system RelE/ParE family toxin [bacterium]|nr:type II toxin-antitoxin system RelE/ParE family toxin [bacterium]
MHVRWTKAASQDLDSIEEYISRDDPGAAILQVIRVIDAVEKSLIESPSIGKPGRCPESREFYISGTPYIVAYRVEDNVLIVLRVIHGARRWPKRI